MEETKSYWKLIGWLKKQKRINVVTFYEEVPVNGILELETIDETRRQIIWKNDPKLLPVLKYERILFFKKDEEIFTLSVIAYDEKEIATTFPEVATEPKLNRSYVRVKVSPEDDIKVMIENKELKVEDISEAGIGITGKKEDLFQLQIGKEYEFLLKIKNEIMKIKGVVVHKETNTAGIKITDISLKDQDKIARYIMNRQREIARKIFMFKD
ncbi:PilZ domain-containing protein [Persephonella sp.]|uniref:PilZ domain-containing protein n=1 Tax=Persephonella sp. TaxID=2060922 RepID=UPI002626AA0B|nr:PilZ domain-containing protein [Persephonella sp.]